MTFGCRVFAKGTKREMGVKYCLAGLQTTKTGGYRGKPWVKLGGGSLDSLYLRCFVAACETL